MHKAQTHTQSTLLPPSEVLVTVVGVGVGMWREIKQRFQCRTWVLHGPRVWLVRWSRTWTWVSSRAGRRLNRWCHGWVWPAQWCDQAREGHLCVGEPLGECLGSLKQRVPCWASSALSYDWIRLGYEAKAAEILPHRGYLATFAF